MGIFPEIYAWKIGLVYGRYLQFRILKWPLTFLSFPSCMSAKCIMINDNWRFTQKRICATSAGNPYIWGFRTMVSAKICLNPIHWWPNFQCICCHQCIIFSHETYAPWVWDTGTCGFIQKNIVPLKSYGLLDQHIFPYPQISMLHQDVFQMFPISALYFPIPFDTIWLFNIAMENHHFIHF